ncbi:MAG: hypothetical protein GXO10_04340 [Crenarchaeota archaeon]|nr:hypothetical protein [Thermoproteota archaeon]
MHAVLTVMVLLFITKCWVILRLKRCVDICTFCTALPENKYHELMSNLKVLNLDIVNRCNWLFFM